MASLASEAGTSASSTVVEIVPMVGDETTDSALALVSNQAMAPASRQQIRGGGVMGFSTEYGQQIPPDVFSTAPPSSVVEAFREKFHKLARKSIITQGQFEALTSATRIEDLLDALSAQPNFPLRAQSKYSPQGIGRGLVLRLKRFESALDSLSQADRAGCLLWCGLKIIVEGCHDVQSTHKFIVSHVEKILDILSSIDFHKKVFENFALFQQLGKDAMLGLYECCLSFIYKSLKFLAKKPLRPFRLFVRTVFASRSFESRLRIIFQNLEAHAERVLSIINMICKMEDFDHRRWERQHGEYLERSVHSILSCLNEARLQRGEIRAPSWNEPTAWHVHCFFDVPLEQHFIGRRDPMSQLQGLLGATGGNGGPVVARVAITGMAGIGKSQFVRQFLAEFAVKYDAIAWINCESIHSFKRSLVAFFDSLKFQVPELSDDEKVQALKRVLEKTHHSWVLILDNCSAGTRSEILSFLPRQRGVIIFTTRDSYLAGRLVDAAEPPESSETTQGPIILPPLTKEESLGLLLAGAGENRTRAEQRYAEELFDKHVGGHPLALRSLRHRALGPQSGNGFATILDEMKAERLPHALDDDDAAESVIKSVEISLRDLGGEAMGIFSVMSYFNTTRIQRRLFLTRVGLPTATLPLPFHPKNSTTLAPFVTEADFDRLISQLQRYGLVTRSEHPSDGVVVGIQPLTSKIVRTLQVNYGGSRETLRYASQVILASIPDHEQPNLPGDWHWGQKATTHLSACRSLAKELNEEPLELRTALLRTGYQEYLWRGDFRSVEKLVMSEVGDPFAPIKSRTELDIRFLALQVKTRSHIARSDSFQATSDRAFCERILVECRKRFGEADPTTLDVKRSLVLLLDPDKAPHQGLKLGAEVLSESTKLHGISDSRTLHLHAHLALYMLRGDTKAEGRRELELAHDRLRSLEYDGRLSYASAFYNLGLAYGRLKDYQQMESTARASLEYTRKTVSPSHPFLCWDVVSVLRSLYLRQQWEEMSSFLQDQLSYVEVTVRHTSRWARIFALIGTEFFDFDWYQESVANLVLLVDHLAEALWDKCAMGFFNQYDETYEAAVQADRSNYGASLDMALEALSLRVSALGRFQHLLTHDRLKFIIELVAQILILSCCQSRDYSIFTGKLPALSQTLTRGLNPEYTKLWQQAWEKIGLTDCEISIDIQHHPGFPVEDGTMVTSYLQMAAYMGNTHALKLVLDQKPDVHLEGVLGRTALYVASLRQNFQAVLVLLGAASKRERLCYDDTSLIHLLCNGEPSTASDDEAARLAAIEKLLEWGFDFGFKDKYGRTALQTARLNCLPDSVCKLLGPDPGPAEEGQGDELCIGTECEQEGDVRQGSHGKKAQNFVERSVSPKRTRPLSTGVVIPFMIGFTITHLAIRLLMRRARR